MNGTSTTRAIVEPGGGGVAPHVGLHALGRFADAVGLGDSLSAHIPVKGERLPVHDRGKVLVHMALVLAGGGESCADVEHLRAVGELFASVASDSTVHRVFHEITPGIRAELTKATAEVRERVWEALAIVGRNETVFLDIDATLVQIHSENKEETAPNYKRGFGFHPLLCFCDLTGEALAGLLRPGNAGANTASDHVSVLDAAIAQLPVAVRAGHAVGDDDEAAGVRIVVRTDSAGTTKKFLAACRERNVGFMSAAITNAQVEGAIFETEGIEELWTQALCQNGKPKKGAAVVELTDLVDLSDFPEGTRLIVRREKLHPGAQRSLFHSTQFRYWGFYTDSDGDPVELDVTMRAHAHVENHIERLKESGLERFPFKNFCANATWMATVMMAADLVRWFQLICLTGYWRNARPKAMRWGFFHAPGRLVHRARQVVVRILDNWPHAQALIDAHDAVVAFAA